MLHKHRTENWIKIIHKLTLTHQSWGRQHWYNKNFQGQRRNQYKITDIYSYMYHQNFLAFQQYSCWFTLEYIVSHADQIRAITMSLHLIDLKISLHSQIAFYFPPKYLYEDGQVSSCNSVPLHCHEQSSKTRIFTDSNTLFVKDNACNNLQVIHSTESLLLNTQHIHSFHTKIQWTNVFISVLTQSFNMSTLTNQRL